mgnify:CR=1 FL=1
MHLIFYSSLTIPFPALIKPCSLGPNPLYIALPAPSAIPKKYEVSHLYQKYQYKLQPLASYSPFVLSIFITIIGPAFGFKFLSFGFVSSYTYNSKFMFGKWMAFDKSSSKIFISESLAP